MLTSRLFIIIALTFSLPALSRFEESFSPSDLVGNEELGLLFVQQKSKNPKSNINVWDNESGQLLSTIRPKSLESNRNEIESLDDGTLLVLANVESKPKLMAITVEREGGEITTSQKEINTDLLKNYRDARDMEFLADGSLNLKAYSIEKEKDVLVTLNVDQLDNTISLDYRSEAIAYTSPYQTQKYAATESISSKKSAIDLESKSVGFTAGALSGVGLSYRRFLESGYGLQLTGIGYGDADNISANLGFQLLKTLHKTDNSRFYGLAGTSIFWSRSEVYDYVAIEQGPKENFEVQETLNARSQNSSNINFGIGLGIEYQFKKTGPSISIEVPITVMLDNKDGKTSFDGIYPIPTLNLHYTLD